MARRAVLMVIIAGCLVVAFVVGSRLLARSRQQSAATDAQMAASYQADYDRRHELLASQAEQTVSVYMNALRVRNYDEAITLQFQVPMNDHAYVAREEHIIKDYSRPLVGWKSCKVGEGDTSGPSGSPISVPVSIVDAHGKHIQAVYYVLPSMNGVSVLRFTIKGAGLRQSHEGGMYFGLY